MQRSPAIGSRPEPRFSSFRRTGCARIVTALLCAALVSAAQATNHLLRMDEIMAALAGDPTVQFIEMTVSDNGQKDWGPQAGETESRAMLVFFDAAGNQTAVFKFPSDPPSGGTTVLIATAAFTARTGVRADFTIPPLLNPGSGKVCFRGNPANRSSFSVNLCLSYGNIPPGLTEGAGPPAPGLPTSGQPTSLSRFQNFAFGEATSRNADFILGSPSPVNTSGDTVNFPVAGPEISVAPALASFGNRDVALGPTAPRSITITSLGTSNALQLSSVTLVGANPEQFRILGDSGQTVLGPNASRIVIVEFDPTTVGLKTAILRIVSNDSDERTADVILQGGGIDNNPCAAPDPLVALAQDLCSQAQLIGPSITYAGEFAGVNSDGFSACIPPGAGDVWYRYVARSNGVLVVSASANVSQSVGLSVHTSCPGTTVNQLACVQFVSQQMMSQLQINVTTGMELFLRLAKVNQDLPPPNLTPPVTFLLSLAGPPAFDFDKNRNGANDNCEFDFGDAPSPYPTTLADNGARHRALAGLFLGSRIDPNANGIPSAAANSDNLDGLANDDDGVTWLGRIVPNRLVPLQVVASGSGRLSAWVDFNADGDWSDPAEQVFTNTVVAAGVNALSLFVPSNAVVTNRTFARFRLNSTGGLSFTGSAADGEVEDYLIQIDPLNTSPGVRDVAITEVLAGLNGDSSVQFVELAVGDEVSRAWGPQSGETNGRAMLVFFDAAGRQTGRFVFPSNAPAGGSNVLVATPAFATQAGLTPDFTMPPEIIAVAGKIAFRENPDGSGFPINVPLSYGGTVYFGPTDGAGPANPASLPILGARSLHRTGATPVGGNRNDAFQAGPPTPRNTAGQTVSLSAASFVEQGRILFSKETFNGNGRTCFSCHLSGRDQFGLTAETIAALPDDDPLFVFEKNVNILKLVTRSQPSDLRGRINSVSGSAEVIGGSGDTYFILGGGQLSGVIADTNGNSGAHVDFIRGDLDGPTASNGSERGLEDHDMLRHGRGLVLENIDGFSKREVFRMSPHLLNIKETAPYGLSGEFSNLRDFSAGAVAQHFPRSMARVSGTDFREPSAEELEAMEAFMNSITTPADSDLSLDRFVTTEAQKRGRALFFNDEARCSKCHSGPTLAHSDGSLAGSVEGVNEDFDTGIANLVINGPNGSNLPTEPAGLARSSRKFNTPPLFGIRLTAPFFHDGSATNLRAAVEFYDGAEFATSPSGALVGSPPAVNDPDKVADLVAFLEALVEVPIQFTRQATFGVRCASGQPPGIVTIGVTNTGTNVLVLSKLAFVGASPEHFNIASDTGEKSLTPGQARLIGIGFKPGSQGTKTTTLEFTASDPNIPGSIRFATALSGALVDNVVTLGPAALAFATRGLHEPPSATQFVRVTNTGSGPLEFVNIQLTGTHPGDFSIVSDSGATNLAAGSVRTLGIAFAPKARGMRTAVLRVESIACSGAVMNVALSGTATPSLDHFEWAPIVPSQGFNTSFPVRISAVDRNGDLMTDFTNTVSLSASSAANLNNPTATIVISELNPGSPDAMEFMNVSGVPVDVSGWEVLLLDQVAITTPVMFTFPAGTVVSPGGIVTVVETGGIIPGSSFPVLTAGFNISWVGSFSNLAVQLRNTQGAVVDFATGSPLGASIFLSPLVPASEWTGGGFPTPAQEDITSYQRTGNSDRNSPSDWVLAPVSMGALNSGIASTFAGPSKAVTLSLTNTTPFISGVWTGQVAVRTEALEIRLNAQDGAGHDGESNPFNVIGTPPTISTIGNMTITEDSLSSQVTFSVNDAETLSTELTVTATSSNAALITSSGIQLGGMGSLRTIRVQPLTNQFGAADITVRVSDGASRTSRDFRLTVLPANDTPVLLPVGNRVVNERTPVSIHLLALDPDLPNDTLTFSMSTLATGASLNVTNGIIQWVPTELQGGLSFNFFVSVRDSLGFTNATSFQVNVVKVNNPPTLDPVPPKSVFAGGLLQITNRAQDLDIPTNFLSFSLATNVSGAGINSTSGVVTWRPLLSQIGLNVLQPVVRDNFQPPMSATQAVMVTVLQPPMTFTPGIHFGTNCVNDPSPPPLTLGITNIGTTNLLLLQARLTGGGGSEFGVLSDSGQTILAPGQARLIQLAFIVDLQMGFGRRSNSFLLHATANDPLGDFLFDIPIAAAVVDTLPSLNVSAIDFGTHSIDEVQSTIRSIVLTNLSAGPMIIDSMVFNTTNSQEFFFLSNPPLTPVPPGASREWVIQFLPRSRGPKSATFVLDVLACGNGHFEVPLAGVGSSTFDHYGWETIAGVQTLGVPFNVRVTAQDRNNQTVTEVGGPATVSAIVTLPTPPPRVVISEIDPGTPDSIEFVNVSGAPLNLSSWQVFLYDEISFPNPVTSFTLNGTAPTNGLFTVTEGGTAPGVFPNFSAGVNLFWQGATTNLAVLLRDNLNNIVDFATTGDRTRIFNPVFIPTNQWSGAGIPAGAVDEVQSYNRTGFQDHNDRSDWSRGARGVGMLHGALTVPFPLVRFLEMFASGGVGFTNGILASSVGVLEESGQVRLRVVDNLGRTTASEFFTVRGAPPVISDIPNQSFDEDTTSQVIEFMVSDAEQAADTLGVTAVSSNLSVVANFGLILGGSGHARTLRIFPLANAFGITAITISVSDGAQTTSETFLVTVNPANDPPVLSPLGSRQVNELQFLTANAMATDLDQTNRLTFSLVAPPIGATINATSGLFSWTPNEAQGPTNTQILVRVSDDGTPSLSATQSLFVTVFEVNSPPLFAPVSNQFVHIGSTLVVTNQVLDPDLPPNQVFFTLLQGPPGAQPVSTNGIFTWTPSLGMGTGDFPVRIRAFDSGSPSLTSTQAFNVRLLPPALTTPTSLLTFSNTCAGAPRQSLSASFVNSGSTPVTITDVSITGANAAEFAVSGDSANNPLAPGQNRTISVEFAPQSAGLKTATLGVSGNDGQASFRVTVALSGTMSDNTASVTPTALNLGTRSIDVPGGPPQSCILSNSGSVNLNGIIFRLSAGDTNDFRIVTDTGQPDVPPGGTRTVGISFQPQRRGARAATLSVSSSACSGSILQVALTGTGTSGLHHFTWDPVPSTQVPGLSFPVHVRAVDRNDEPVTQFTGTVGLSAFGVTDLQPLKPVLITEIDISNDAVEFMNVSGRPVDVSGWRVLFYELPAAPVASVIIPSGNILGSNSIFLVAKFGTAPGVFPNLFTGTAVNWTSGSTNLSVLLLDAEGVVVDFATLGSSTAIFNPVSISSVHWRGAGIPATAMELQTSYQRQGVNDRNDNSDWVTAFRSLNTPNSNLASVFLNVSTNTPVRVTPANTTAFVAGEWSGTVTLLDEARAVQLRADDGLGHAGVSGPFDSFDEPPFLTIIPDQTLDEDTPVPTITFTVGDDRTAVSNLIVFVRSSNTNFLPDSRITLLGDSSSRELRITPGTNQSGVTIITVTVSDGAQTNSDAFVLNMRPVNDPPVMLLVGGSTEGFRENFDLVTRPALPAGWVATTTDARFQWQTVGNVFDTSPNSVSCPDPSTDEDITLTSPAILLGPSPTNMTFRHSFSTESCCDGGFLEASVNGSVFSNVTYLGWVFTAGAYNSAGTNWRGSSSGFITTALRLPQGLANQSVRFRWRFISDTTVPGGGWFVDSVHVPNVATTNLASIEDVPIVLSVPVSDAETPPGALELVVTSSNPILVPSASIKFGGTDSVRTVTVTPATNQSGVADLTLTLSDGVLTVTQFVTLTFLSINDPPTFAPVPDQVVDEGTMLVVNLSATDPDLGTNQLRFTPVSMPNGATLNQTSGVVSWTPTEFDGPSFNMFNISVSDNGTPPLSTSQMFFALVREVNSAPELQPVPLGPAYPGLPISGRFTAFDSDVPANSLRFSLESPPPGALMDTFSGQFNWTPGLEHIGTNQIVVRVTDDGVPPLNATLNVPVSVLAGPLIHSLLKSTNGVVLRWHGLPGARYRVEYTDQLQPANWTVMPGDTIAIAAALMSKTDPNPHNRQRFYRVQFVPVVNPPFP